MKINKQFKNWWIDALLMVGYLFCFYLDLTGVGGHQWLGAALTLLAVVHLWLHFDWVKAVTKRLFGKGGARNRWYYLLDVLIVVGFIVILETGLIISTWFDLAVVNYIAWLDLHIYASYATLALILVKIGIHWRWVVNITAKIWGEKDIKSPVKTPVPGLTPVFVQTRREVVDRRQFLAMMGVVSLGSLLAISNVISENAVKPVKALGVLAEADGTADASSPAAEATAEPSELAAVDQSSATSAPAEAETAAASETLPATPEPTQAVAMCSVQCPKGCAFPGRCRRYIDQNGNGLCDLGECL